MFRNGQKVGSSTGPQLNWILKIPVKLINKCLR